MNIAFDARCLGRDPDSMERVLRVLLNAAQAAGWAAELWLDGSLRSKDPSLLELVRPAATWAQSSSEVLWSPETSALPVSIPKVATLHDVNPLLPDGRSSIARWRRRRRFISKVKSIIHEADKLVTDTEDARKRVEAAFPVSRGRLGVVPLYVDPGIQPLRGSRMMQELEPLGLGEGYILFVGSMRRHKNWDGLIRSYAMLPESLRSKVPLVYAGRAKRARGEAEALISELGLAGQVHILGEVSEQTLRALYGGAALLACVSFMEGFGFPPLEAMACGVPVVATNRTCVPEVLGDAAVYVDPASEREISEALQVVLEDKTKRDALVDAGLRQARTFNAERTAQAMLEVCRLLG